MMTKLMFENKFAGIKALDDYQTPTNIESAIASEKPKKRLILKLITIFIKKVLKGKCFDIFMP